MWNTEKETTRESVTPAETKVTRDNEMNETLRLTPTVNAVSS